jgi:uncharacterized protein with beta-barrel porin domain
MPIPQCSCDTTKACGPCATRRGLAAAQYLAPSLAVAATLLAWQSARADCTTTAPNETLCSGVTLNQGGGAPGTSADAHGYGTGAALETVTVSTGASVTGNANAGSVGIYLGQGTIVNNTGATITGVSAAIRVNGTSPLAVINSGIIQTPGLGVYGLGQVTVTNNAGGSIAGTSSGIYGTSLELANYGTIIGTSFNGASAFTSGTITNYGGGTITGGTYGVSVNQVGSINNYGAISGGNQAGVLVGTDSTVNNYAGGTITGISGSGSHDAAVAVGANSLINNFGTITGSFYGIYNYSGGGVSIYNSGRISASVFDSATNTIDAILFAGSGNTLTLAPGSTIAGTVLGSGTDAFQLGGSGAATFDVSQIASTGQYRGFGTFNKIGDSNWSLIGTSTFSGPVTINGGTLSVNGDISSASGVTVNAGGALGGTGTVRNVDINGGTLAPGNSIGTLNVLGSLTFTAASTYLIEVSPSFADRSNVVGAAVLGGASVRAVFSPGSYISKQYTILSAMSGVSGTFGALSTNLSPYFSTSLSYDASDVYLNLAVNFATPSGLNSNQQNVGSALANYFNFNQGIPAIYGTLTAGGLTQASGESATGNQQTAINAMNQFMGVLTDPFVAGRGETVASSGVSAFAASDTGRRTSRAQRGAYALMSTKGSVADAYDPRWSLWAAGFGGSQTTNGNAALGSNNTTSNLTGLAVGADYRFSPNTVAGFALAGAGASFSVENGGSGRSDLFQVGAFIRHISGSAYVSAALAYGFQDIATDRTVTIAGTDRLHAEFNANAYSGRIEGGYRFVPPWLGSVGLTPYTAGQFTTFDLPSYAESVLSGSPAFALAYGAQSITDSRSELGVRSDKAFALSNAMLTLRGRLAWAHDFNANRSIATTFQALPGASFVVNGAAQPHDSALTTISAELRWMNGWSAAGTFEGEFAGMVRSYAGKGIVRYSW